MDLGVLELDRLPVYKIDWVDASKIDKDENTGQINPFVGSLWSCVDGRLERAALRFPGGHAGLFMAFLGTLKKLNIGFDFNEALSFFLEKTHADNLLYHTDDHAHDPQFKCAGCGHLNMMRQNPDKYGVSKGWLYIFNVQSNLQEELKTDKAEVLHGEHDEQFALVIEGTEQTILPTRSGISFFVMHTDIAVELLTILAAQYARVDEHAAREAVKLAVKAQSDPTFKALVQDKGLSVYTYRT